MFLGWKYAIEGMKQTGPDKPPAKGSILDISSIAGLIGSRARPPTAPARARAAASKSVALFSPSG